MARITSDLPVGQYQTPYEVSPTVQGGTLVSLEGSVPLEQVGLSFSGGVLSGRPFFRGGIVLTARFSDNSTQYLPLVVDAEPDREQSAFPAGIAGKLDPSNFQATMASISELSDKALQLLSGNPNAEFGTGNSLDTDLPGQSLLNGLMASSTKGFSGLSASGVLKYRLLIAEMAWAYFQLDRPAFLKTVFDDPAYDNWTPAELVSQGEVLPATGDTYFAAPADAPGGTPGFQTYHPSAPPGGINLTSHIPTPRYSVTIWELQRALMWLLENAFSRLQITVLGLPFSESLVSYPQFFGAEIIWPLALSGELYDVVRKQSVTLVRTGDSYETQNWTLAVNFENNGPSGVEVVVPPSPRLIFSPASGDEDPLPEDQLSDKLPSTALNTIPIPAGESRNLFFQGDPTESPHLASSPNGEMKVEIEYALRPAGDTSIPPLTKAVVKDDSGEDFLLFVQTVPSPSEPPLSTFTVVREGGAGIPVGTTQLPVTVTYEVRTGDAIYPVSDTVALHLFCHLTGSGPFGTLQTVPLAMEVSVGGTLVGRPFPSSGSFSASIDVADIFGPGVGLVEGTFILSDFVLFLNVHPTLEKNHEIGQRSVGSSALWQVS